jgi:hypothetical protein
MILSEKSQTSHTQKRYVWMIPFIKNSRKSKLIYSDRRETKMDKSEEGWTTKGQDETLGYDTIKFYMCQFYQS